MASVVQEVPKNEGHGAENRNTGFPEPLSHDRNTTLPHPDADLSSNPTLEGADIALTRTNSRRRFHLHRTKSSLSKSGVTSSKNSSKADVGLITNPADMYKGIEYADGTKEDGSGQPQVGRDSGVDMGMSHQRDGSISASGSEDDGEGGRRKKRGLLEKLHLRK